MKESDFSSYSAFQNLSQEKFDFLMNFMGQKKSNNTREMMALLMAFTNKAKGQGITFTPSEKEYIIEHLKQNMSPAERQKTDLILNMLKRKS